MAQGSSTRLSPDEGRKFAFTLAVAFGALAALMWWRDAPHAPLALGGVAAAWALAGILVPGHLGPAHAAWMGLAHVISRVTTPVFMGVVYYLVVTPIGVVRRMAGNPLRAVRGKPSAWIDRRAAPRGDLTRQF